MGPHVSSNIMIMTWFNERSQALALCTAGIKHDLLEIRDHLRPMCIVWMHHACKIWVMMLWHMLYETTKFTSTCDSWPLKCPAMKIREQKNRLWPKFASFRGTDLDDPQDFTASLSGHIFQLAMFYWFKFQISPFWVAICFIHDVNKPGSASWGQRKWKTLQCLLQSTKERKDDEACKQYQAEKR